MSWPSCTAPGNAEEERPGCNLPRVVGEIADLDLPAPDHLARGERPDQRLELHGRRLVTSRGLGAACQSLSRFRARRCRHDRPSSRARRAAPRDTGARTGRSRANAGAATTPPQMAPCGSSTATRIARRGLRAQARARRTRRRTSPRSGRSPASPRSRSCPRRCSPGSQPRAPVPSTTTLRSIAITRSAVARETTRPAFAWPTRFAADSRDEVRRAHDAAVPDRGVGGDHLHGCHRDALADRDRPDRRARPAARAEAPCRGSRPGSRSRSGGRSRTARSRRQAAPRRAPPRSSRCRRSTSWRGSARTVIRSVPRSCASWIQRSATRICGGSKNGVVGATIPSSSAAAIVTSLNVEPGS